MGHSRTLGDRIAQLLLALLAVLNILFLLAFVAAAIAARPAVAAPARSCSGHDLLAALQREQPAKAAAIEREAAAIPNGRGLLWRVARDGHVSYLFGTMHLTDPRVLDLPPAAAEALAGARTLAIETTDVLEPSNVSATLLAHPDLTLLADGTTLASLLPAADNEAVDAALAARGIAPERVAKMKPWVVSAMLSLPACELARQAEGAPVLDVALAKQARAAGKSVVGLETALSQFQAMASLPMSLHIAALVETARLGPRVDDLVETMIGVYQSGDTGAFLPLFRSAIAEDSGTATGFAAFQAALITGRNQGMADRAIPLLNQGGAFIAVGALHLPGEDGLVARLRKAGYAVTPAG